MFNEFLQHEYSKNWKFCFTFSCEESYCLIFNQGMKQIGFSKVDGYDESVVKTAFETAKKTYESGLRAKERLLEKEPFLFNE